MVLDEFDFELPTDPAPLGIEPKQTAWSEPCGLRWGDVYWTYIALGMAMFVIGIAVGVLGR